MLSLHRRNGERLARVLAEGVQEGEVRDDLDLYDMTLALVGMVNLRVLCCLEEGTCAHDMAERVLDIFFQGVAPGGAA